MGRDKQKSKTEVRCWAVLWRRLGKGRIGVSLIAQMVKSLPAMQETHFWSPGWEDPLEKEMATHLGIFAWKIPWTEEPPGWRSPWGCKELDVTERLTLYAHHHHVQFNFFNCLLQLWQVFSLWPLSLSMPHIPWICVISHRSCFLHIQCETPVTTCPDIHI